MMDHHNLDLHISKLGECRVPSPMSDMQFVGDEEHVLFNGRLNEIKAFLDAGEEPPWFEAAGPRQKI